MVAIDRETSGFEDEPEPKTFHSHRNHFPFSSSTCPALQGLELHCTVDALGQKLQHVRRLSQHKLSGASAAAALNREWDPLGFRHFGCLSIGLKQNNDWLGGSGIIHLQRKEPSTTTAWHLLDCIHIFSPRTIDSALVKHFHVVKLELPINPPAQITLYS